MCDIILNRIIRNIYNTEYNNAGRCPKKLVKLRKNYEEIPETYSFVLNYNKCSNWPLPISRNESACLIVFMKTHFSISGY